MKIKSENTFLKHFLKNANQYGEVNISKTFTQDLIAQSDLQYYIQSLSKKGYIQYVDTQHYQITPYGRNAYVPIRKKFFKAIFNGTKITLREVISFLLGILSAIIVAIALKWLGFD